MELISGAKRLARTSDLVFAYKRDLEQEDLAMMASLPKMGVQAPERQRMRARHHRLAQLIAQGQRPGMAGAMLGYVASTVSILQQDPAFKQLIAVYAKQAEENLNDLHKRAAMLGESAIDELQSRLDEKPTQFTVHELTEISRHMLGSHRNAPPGAGGPGGVSINVQFVQPDNMKVVNG